jgi:energy-coupling factor transporter ATP-binding protein EcfA2
MLASETLISQLVEQLKKMAQAIRWSEKGCLLIAATEEPALEREMARALRERIEPEFKVSEFTFSAQPSENLRLAYILTAVSPPAHKSALFLYGLDDLAPEDRQTAIDGLNGGRGFLSRTGYSVVLWVRPATIGDLMFKAPDFYSWRTGTHTFELPADSTRRAQTLAALGLYAPVNLEELRQRYLNYVVESYRWLDFRGLLQVRNIIRLPLTELFVPWSATIRVNERMVPITGREEKKKKGGTGERGIKPKLEFCTVRPFGEKWKREKGEIGIQELQEEIEAGAFKTQETEKRVELHDALKEQSRLVVLGEPGAGKSTLLKYLALTFAEGPAAAQSRLQLNEERLPVLIPISAYAETRREQKSALTLDEFIPKYFSDRSLPNLASLFSAEMKNGRALLLFDGMDEVLTIEERREMAREIQALAGRYPQSRVIVTSRITGYDAAPLGSDFTHITITEFGPNEIESYARKWSLAYERAGIPEGAPLSHEAQTRVALRAKNLIHAIKGNPSVERLAKNPLLLTILALIHHLGTRLPQRRVELYRLCIEALAETWNLARTPERPMEFWLGERRLDERQLVRILAPVAFWMHENKPAGLISREELTGLIARHFKEKEGKTSREAKKLADDFITLMQQAAALLVERGQNQFGFLHLTFQEYLAARFLAERKNRRELVRPDSHQARWHEVNLMTAELLEADGPAVFAQAIP